MQDPKNKLTDSLGVPYDPDKNIFNDNDFEDNEVNFKKTNTDKMSWKYWKDMYEN